MTQDPTYNTLMAVCAGLGLLMLVSIGFQISRGANLNRHAWAAGFAAPGLLLTFLGAHMTVTWPLSGPTAFDNIVFGEPSLAMGVLLLVGAYLLGSDRYWTAEAMDGSISRRRATSEQTLSRESWPHFARLLGPLSWLAFPMGLALIAIAVVGPVYKPWEAPPNEPITGEFTNQEWLENGFLAIVFLLNGIGALLTPFALRQRILPGASRLMAIIGVCWFLSGAVWLGFGALNYYTHIGLTINTAKESAQPPAQEAPDIKGGAPQAGP
jgi:uncharacterized membrane protein